MFLGHGDVIATGDKNGQLNTSDVTVSNNTATFTTAGHSVFVAGGRMFSMTDETITLPVKPLRGQPDAFVGSLFVEISANGPEFVKVNNSLTTVPANNNYDADNYVSKFDIVITRAMVNIQHIPLFITTLNTLQGVRSISQTLGRQ